jgi:hypothetical protein
MRPPNQESVDVFAPEFINETVLTELEALNWIEKRTAVSIGKTSTSFTLNLGGATKVDREKINLFLEDLKVAWSTKNGDEDPLIIEASLLIDGDAARGGMAI